MPKRSQTRPSSGRAALAALAAFALVACAESRERAGTPQPRVTAAPATTTTAPRPAEVRVAAAGDIACRPGLPTTRSECQHEATAQLVERLDPAVVLALGDLQYEFGEAANFAAAYDPTWGRFKSRTRPAPGNHEYAGGRANGYYGYWGDTANPPNGWYSFDLPEVGWHVVVLNSVCSVVGCGEGSAQLAWLRSDLASSTAPCSLAAWHHPRYSSGLHEEDRSVHPLWQAFSEGGGDVVLSGHDHHYERFAVQEGVRQFVAGTGGRNLYPVVAPIEHSEAVDTTHFGVLELVLRDGAYRWRFVTTDDEVLDEGQAVCR